MLQKRGPPRRAKLAAVSHLSLFNLSEEEENGGRRRKRRRQEEKEDVEHEKEKDKDQKHLITR